MEECPSSGPNSDVDNDYEFSYDKGVRTPFLNKLNPRDLPSAEYNAMVNQLTNNSLRYVIFEVEKPTWSYQTFLGLFNRLLQQLAAFLPGQDRAVHLRDYVLTFLVNEIPPGFEIDGPEKEYVVGSTRDLDETNSTISDKAFGEYRLSGPNCVVIRLCTAQYGYLERLGFGTNAAMLQLLHDGRLFVVDFTGFALFSPSASYQGSPDKHTYGAAALFKQVVGDRHLTPVCIQVISHNGSSEVVFPNNGIKWNIAKAVFQSIDAFYQSPLAHLAGTHFVVEPFLVATYRRLPRCHPLYVLLDKHFEGTAFINNASIDALVFNQSALNLVTSIDVSSNLDLLADFTADILSKDMTFPARIKARQMDQAKSLDYPYRDDGMLLWDAILRWTTKYLQIYYRDNQQVLNDKYLCAWLSDLESSAGGNVKWINTLSFDRYNAKESLSSLVASIIFFASVEHAAMNFQIRPVLQFTGVYPSAIYAGDDVVFKQNPTQADFMSLFPPMKMARLQVQLVQLLGSIRYTRLGFYDTAPSNGTAHPVGAYFLDTVCTTYFCRNRHDVVEALRDFQKDLKKISRKIHIRNSQRQHMYVEMIPEGIPSSINT